MYVDTTISFIFQKSSYFGFVSNVTAHVRIDV